MSRGALRRTCPQWGVDPAGLTRKQIIDLLLEAGNRYYLTGQLLRHGPIETAPDQLTPLAEPEQIRRALGLTPQVPLVAPPLASAGPSGTAGPETLSA